MYRDNIDFRPAISTEAARTFQIQNLPLCTRRDVSPLNARDKNGQKGDMDLYAVLRRYQKQSAMRVKKKTKTTGKTRTIVFTASNTPIKSQNNREIIAGSDLQIPAERHPSTKPLHLRWSGHCYISTNRIYI